jgi:hypothetical protein
MNGVRSATTPAARHKEPAASTATSVRPARWTKRRCWLHYRGPRAACAIEPVMDADETRPERIEAGVLAATSSSTARRIVWVTRALDGLKNPSE